MLAALQDAAALFLVVGAHALAVHGVPRATGDLDIFVPPDLENSKRVLKALVEFGAPIQTADLTAEDLAKPGTIYQIGLPPRRIDLITDIDGLSFEEAWESRVIREVAGLQIPFLGRDALLRNKRASGRTKDLADVELLERRSPD
jgi:hypothetical protein